MARLGKHLDGEPRQRCEDLVRKTHSNGWQARLNAGTKKLPDTHDAGVVKVRRVPGAGAKHHQIDILEARHVLPRGDVGIKPEVTQLVGKHLVEVITAVHKQSRPGKLPARCLRIPPEWGQVTVAVGEGGLNLR